VPRICRQSAHEDGKIIGPKHWTPLPPGDQKITLILDYVTGRVDPRAIVRSEGLSQ